MRLSAEILRALGAGGETSRVQYTVVGGRGGYFQNVKRLLEFSAERIVLRGKEGKIVVAGEGLSLGKLEAEDAVICGKILSVSEEGE